MLYALCVQYRLSERRNGKMKESVVIFENEAAARILNYFISYKAIVKKNENQPVNTVDDDITVTLLPRTKVLTIK